MDEAAAACSPVEFRYMSRQQQWTVLMRLRRDSPALRKTGHVVAAVKLTLAAAFVFCVFKPVVEVEKGLALLVYLVLAHGFNEVVWCKVQRPMVERELAARGTERSDSGMDG